MGINPKKHGMAKGFVPNYNRFLVDALKKAGQGTKKAGKFGWDKFKNMSPEQQSNLSMGAMFMGPMASEMMMGEDRQTAGTGQRMAAGAAMGAGYGAMFGPKGAIIGGIAGGIYGGVEGMMKEDTGEAFKELSEAKKGLDKIMSDTKAISEYGNALSGLDEAMKTGDLTAMDEIEASLQESLANIADPELLSGLVELQDSGASAAQSLDFVNKKLSELQGQAMALQKAVGASDKLTKRVDDESGFWNWAGNTMNAVGDMAISGLDASMEFLGSDFTETTYSERRRQDIDLMGEGKQGDVVAKDLAKGYIDSIKEFSKVDPTSILAELSDGTRKWSNFDTKGKSIQELKQDTVLMASVREEAANETLENYENMTGGMLQKNRWGGYRVEGKFREQMENTVGGDKNLKIFEEQLTDSDKFRKAFLEGLDAAEEGLEDLVNITVDGYSKAIERENNAAKLQKELQAGYENMLNLQERIANTISSVKFTDAINKQDRNFKANYAAEGLEFMNANGGMSRQDVLAKQNQINQAMLKENSSDSLKSELLGILKSTIDPTATFKSDEIEKKYGENIKEADPRTAKGRAQKGLEDEAQEEQAMLAEKFDTFLKANEDGNLTLEEMTSFLQSIDAEGKVGNGILKQAQTAAERNSKQLAQEMKQASLNMLKTKAITAAERLGSMGGSIMGKDEQLELANLTAKGAFQGKDAKSLDSTLKFINMIGADPSDFGIDKTAAQYAIAQENVDLAEAANRAGGGDVDFDPLRKTLEKSFQDIKAYEDKSEQLMKEILGEGGSKQDVDVQVRDILANIYQDGLNIKNLDGITGALNSVAEQLQGNQNPVENQTPGVVSPTQPTVKPDPTEVPIEVAPDVTKNKVEPPRKPVVVEASVPTRENMRTDQRSGWSYYPGYQYSGWSNYAGSASGYSKKVDDTAPTQRKSKRPRRSTNQANKNSDHPVYSGTAGQESNSSQNVQDIVKNEKESSEKLVQKLEDVNSSIQTTEKTDDVKRLEATISELRLTIETIMSSQQAAISSEPASVEGDSGQQAYENFIAAVDNNTNHLEILSAAVDRVGSEVANLSDVIHVGVGAISAALKNTASSDTNISREQPDIQDPKSPKPVAIPNSTSAPSSSPNPFLRPKKYTPEKQQARYYEEGKRAYQEKFPVSVSNPGRKDSFDKPSDPSKPKDYPDTPTTQRRSSQPIIDNTWAPAAEELKRQSYEATPSIAPLTYSTPQTFSEPTRPQQNPGYGSVFADKSMNSRPMDMSVALGFSRPQNYSTATPSIAPLTYSTPQTFNAPTRPQQDPGYGSVFADKSMNSRPMDMSVALGFSRPQNYSTSIEAKSNNIESMTRSVLEGRSMNSMSMDTASMSGSPLSNLSRSANSISMNAPGFAASMEGIMSPVSRDFQQFSNLNPSSPFAPAMPGGYGAPSSGYPNPLNQTPPSYAPPASQPPVSGAPVGQGDPMGESEAIVTAVNQLKESFEAKPPVGTEEMQELIGAVNNVEAAYRESIPDDGGQDPPGGDGDGSSVGQITDALQNLPAELKAQLQEITFSHAITGDVKFNFNTEAMAGALGPALNGQLKEILKEPMILDVLAKALKGRIDPSGILGRQ